MEEWSKPENRCLTVLVSALHWYFYFVLHIFDCKWCAVMQTVYSQWKETILPDAGRIRKQKGARLIKFSGPVAQMVVVVKELQILDLWQRSFKDERPSVALKQLYFTVYPTPSVLPTQYTEKKLSDLQQPDGLNSSPTAQLRLYVAVHFNLDLVFDLSEVEETSWSNSEWNLLVWVKLTLGMWWWHTSNKHLYPGP